MDFGRNTTLNRRNQGFTGLGVDLTSSFFENIIYIFCAVHFLIFLFIVFFFKNSFMRRSAPRKQNEGHSQRSNCRKHHNHVLSSYHYWRCMWLRLSVWVSVCAHTSRCNMELLFGNEEAFRLPFFGTEKKIALFHFGSSAPPSPPSHFIFTLNKFVLLWNRHIMVSIQLLLRVVVNRGGLGREPEMEQGLAPSRLWCRTSVQTTLAGRKSQKAGTNSTFAKTRSLFVQPSCCSLFDVQHSRKLPAPARSSSVRAPGTQHKTTAGHQHCNFLTYNKAISYFLPYKWK